MILSAVCTSNLLQAIFLQVVLVLFTAFGTYQSFSTGFSMVSIFLSFKAPQWCWDILLNSLKTDLHLIGSMGLIKCQDCVGLDSFFAFSNGDSYICNSLLFIRADAISSSVVNANSLLLITPLEVLSFSCG